MCPMDPMGMMPPLHLASLDILEILKAESPATDVTPGFMRCTAPELPIEQRPDNRCVGGCCKVGFRIQL